MFLLIGQAYTYLRPCSLQRVYGQPSKHGGDPTDAVPNVYSSLVNQMLACHDELCVQYLPVLARIMLHQPEADDKRFHAGADPYKEYVHTPSNALIG